MNKVQEVIKCDMGHDPTRRRGSLDIFLYPRDDGTTTSYEVSTEADAVPFGALGQEAVKIVARDAIQLLNASETIRASVHERGNIYVRWALDSDDESSSEMM
jgi:hypothetical protein